MLARSVSLILLVLVFALGCGAGQRNNTIRAGVVTLNAARDGFLAWDGEHQMQIVKDATTYEEGRKRLDDYRALRDDVIKTFFAVYNFFIGAATQSDDPSLKTAFREAEKLYATIVKLKDDAKRKVINREIAGRLLAHVERLLAQGGT